MFIPTPEIPGEVAEAAQAGQTFSGYVLLRKLGAGASGTVHLAWQRSLGRFVALKLLHPGTAVDAERFLREVQIEAALSHPNIVPIYDVGAHEGRAYLAMKYIAGATLADGRLHRRKALEVMQAAAAALEYAHERGIVHRDLKPANLMLDHDGQTWVMDFGIARPMKDGATVTADGRTIGTPAYMPPEQARGGRCDGRSDVYSLGATLYELVTGRPPFVGSVPIEVMMAVMRAEPPAPRTLDPTISVELEAIVQKAMDKNPARRYASARAFGDDLRRCLAGEPVAARPVGPFGRALKWSARHPVASATAAVGAGALLVLAVGAGLYVANVTRARAQAERERNAAELKLGQSLVSQGDALGLAGRWLDAQARYDEARATFLRVGAPALAPDLGLIAVHQNAPPPLQSYEGHEQRVAAVVFTPDGRQALSASEDRTVRLWDVVTGREVRALRGHTDGVWALALAPGGRTVASGGWDGTVRLWDVTTGAAGAVLARDGSKIHALAFTPDGKTLLSGHADGTVTVWDVGTARARRTLSGQHGGQRVRTLAVARDGQSVVSGGWNGSLVRWELPSGDVRWATPAGPGYVFSAAFTPDGQHLLVGRSDRGVRVLDAATGARRGELQGHTGFVAQVVVARDGRRAFSASWDGTVRSWDLLLRRPERVLGRQRERLYALVLSPDERTVLASGEHGTLRLWDAAPEIPAVWRTGDEQLRAVAVSPDGRLVASGGGEGTVLIWDAASGQRLGRLSTGAGQVQTVVFTPDGRALISSGPDGGAKVWDLARGAATATLADEGGALKATVARGEAVGAPAGAGVGRASLSLSADGRRALLIARPGLSLWELPAGKKVATVRSARTPRRAELLPDGRTALAVHGDGTLALLDLQGGGERWSRRAHDGSIYALAASPDGRFALTGATDNVIKQWEVATGTLVRTLRGHSGQVRGLAIARDGTWAASASEDDTVRLWSLESGRELHSFVGHEDRVLGVAIANDGGALVSISGNGTVRFWDFLLGGHLRAHHEILRRARAALTARPEDAGALADLGRWFAFRGVCDLATQAFERARSGGGRIPASPLVPCGGVEAEAGIDRAPVPASRPPLDLLEALSAR